MNLTCDKAAWHEDSEGFWLSLRTQDRAAAVQLSTQVDRLYTVEAKPWRAKRSLDANAYAWLLLDALADAVGATKEELYVQKVREVGPFKDFTLSEDEAKTFRVAWGRLGTGWPTEVVDYAEDQDRVVVRAYYGSSTYNTKQMSRLIDSIVEDCKEVGIETLPPEKLSAMKEEWHHTQAH